jgi:hypothetical protein
MKNCDLPISAGGRREFEYTSETAESIASSSTVEVPRVIEYEPTLRISSIGSPVK